MHVPNTRLQSPGWEENINNTNEITMMMILLEKREREKLDWIERLAESWLRPVKIILYFSLARPFVLLAGSINKR